MCIKISSKVAAAQICLTFILLICGMCTGLPRHVDDAQSGVQKEQHFRIKQTHDFTEIHHRQRSRRSPALNFDSLPDGFSLNPEDLEAFLSQAEESSQVDGASYEPVENPDCFVSKEKVVEIGGRCGRVRGGMPYCEAHGLMYMNHLACKDTPAK